MTRLRTHLRTTFAIIRKDILEIVFSKPTMSMLLTPIMLAVMFAVLSGLLAIQPTRLLVYNPDGSHVGDVVSRSLPGAEVILAKYSDEVTAAFTSGKNPSYTLGLIVPRGFDASLERGEHPQLTLYFNEGQLNTLQRQRVVSAINNYASGISPTPPAVIIAPATSDPATLFFTLDLNAFYVAMALITSISVGISLVSTLLVEEKERKTLHMLLVSPATLTDVVLGKLFVGVAYQVILSVVVMALLRGFVGNLPMVFLFLLLITGFGHALSLLAGSVFHTTSGLGGFLGIVSLLFILPMVFVSPLGGFFGTPLLDRVFHLLPTYYMADGLLNALENQGTVGDNLVDLTVTIVGMFACLIAAIWILHRQTAVTASI